MHNYYSDCGMLSWKIPWRMPVVMGGGHQKGCSCQVVESKGRRVMWGQQAPADVPPSMLSSPSSCEGVPGVFLPVQLIGCSLLFSSWCSMRTSVHSRCEKCMMLKWSPDISPIRTITHFQNKCYSSCCLSLAQWQGNALKSLLAFRSHQWHSSKVSKNFEWPTGLVWQI